MARQGEEGDANDKTDPKYDFTLPRHDDLFGAVLLNPTFKGTSSKGEENLRMRRALQAWYRNIVSLDLRSLALVRICYGVLLLCDLLVRSSSLAAHYTDAGVYPLAEYFRIGHSFVFSFHALGGSAGFVCFLFLLHAMAAVCLLLGYRTQLATVVCWVLLASLHNRNYLVLNGGDTWLRSMLFWAIFLPWGRCWSLDARRADSDQKFGHCSTSTLAFLIQVFLVYWLAGVFKTGAAWWSEGTAIFYSVSLTEWNAYWAYYLLYFPKALQVLTFVTLFYELVMPLLLFFPWKQEQIRTFFVFLTVSFHFGLFVALEIGIFPFVGIATVIGLLPGWFWKTRAGKRVSRFMNSLFAKLRLMVDREFEGPAFRSTPLVQTVVALLLGYIVYWNVATGTDRITIAPRARVLGYLLNMDQYWGLFAPEPPRGQTWFVAAATLSGGGQVDLLRDGRPLVWGPPDSSKVYKSQRWKRFLVGWSSDNGIFTRKPFAHYLYRRWKVRYPDIQSVRFYRVYRLTNLNFEDEPPYKDHLLTMSRRELEEGIR